MKRPNKIEWENLVLGLTPVENPPLVLVRKEVKSVKKGDLYTPLSPTSPVIISLAYGLRCWWVADGGYSPFFKTAVEGERQQFNIDLFPTCLNGKNASLFWVRIEEYPFYPYTLEDERKEVVFHYLMVAKKLNF